MKAYAIIGIFILGFIEGNYAQKMERNFLGSAGRNFSNASYIVSYGIGEPIISSKFIPYIYTQGFQQTNSIVLLPPYCNTSATSTKEYINRVSLSLLTNNSGNNNGYGNYRSLFARFTTGATYSVNIIPAWTGTKRAEYYRVWIDYNRDGDFDDANEMVVNISKSSSTSITSSFVIPATLIPQNTGLRVAMKNGSAPLPCEMNYSGEVEDYSVAIENPILDNQAPTPPANLSTSNVTSTTLLLKWKASTDNIKVTGYDVYRNATLYGSTAIDSLLVTGLSPSTKYSFYIKARDSANNSSDTSNNVSATTLALSYCATSGSTTLREYINKFQLGSINNTSGPNISGYGNYLSITINLTMGSTNPLTIIPRWNGTARSEAYRVWFDFNHDGDFLDAGEQVFNQSKTTATTINGNIIIPSTISTGTTRMRVIMKYNSSPTPCETAGFAGEAEDYTVNITAAAIIGQSNNLRSTKDTDNSSFEIYPNPVHQSEVILRLKGIASEQILIYDMSGVLVKSTCFEKRLDVSSLANGTYLLVIIDKGQIRKRKLVKY